MIRKTNLKALNFKFLTPYCCLAKSKKLGKTLVF